MFINKIEPYPRLPKKQFKGPVGFSFSILLKLPSRLMKSKEAIANSYPKNGAVFAGNCI